ncbi:MAG: outer membrane lipoprotein-sorting protein [Elusimicrobia bacterium]|nr:outer membrane lipoprotein-sorting protein [Elusimicrobiota bacterium]
MTIITSSGEERTFIYDSYSKNRGEKNLIRYIEPSRARGQAILMLNNADDIWAYFPRTGRVRKLATHAKRQKMEGSDFSYEDMGSGDAFLDDYTSRLLGEEEKEGYMCHKLELERKQGSDAGYSRLVIWVIKENYFPVAIQYYDLDDSRLLLKELIQYDIRMIENIPTGMKIVMYNRTDDTKTVMEILKVDYDAELGDELFTERGLLK